MKEKMRKVRYPMLIVWGQCYFNLLAQGKNYIPIHKKPWKIAENLDIIVPFGYNTVIVKSRQNKKKKPVRDRFEEAFYSD